jgi:CO/xanthine dehydrogenase Mo-binding subunit
MNAPHLNPGLSRRNLLQAAGALIVGVSPLGAAVFGEAEAAPAGKPALHPAELDSWVAIGKDGKVTAYFGKIDMGQGVDVAISQIVGEELDVPAEKINLVMGDTFLTCNQGGVSGSTGVQSGGIAMRNASAEARRLLFERASQKLGVPVDRLEAWDGVISVTGEPARKVGYGELVGDGYFHTRLEWNGQYGNGLVAKGQAKVKSPKDYRVVGKSVPRFDVAEKVYGTLPYVTDFKLPGMLHARVIRPPVAGALPVSVDEASIKTIPGARVVRTGEMVAVLAPKEWDAVKASRAVKVTWSDAKPAFPEQWSLYGHLRSAPAAKTDTPPDVGNVDEAFAAATEMDYSGQAELIQAEYEWPFQSHASMGPACAVADVKPNSATVWTGSQKPHAVAEGCAKLLKRPPGSVRAISMVGPGSYGRNDAGDAAQEATLLSSVVGKPVRVQGMRHDGTGWDPKGPASIHIARAAITKDGDIVVHEFESRGFSRNEVNFSETDPRDTLAGQLNGFPNDPQGQLFGHPEDDYSFPAKRQRWETVNGFLAKANPLRGAHLRDPLGPQIHFASESFMDELAAAVVIDPIELRLKHLKNPRDHEVIKAAAKLADWKPGAPGTRAGKRGEILTGRGFAFSRRGATTVAVVSDVEVDPGTGRVWCRRFYLAHDCGLVVNPQGLRQCIEGNVVQGVSRTLFEEVTFDTKAVKSVDWNSYPILTIEDAPETVEIELINRPEIAPSGAGEPSIRPISAAIANAVYDATGVRIRRAPFTPERVKAAIEEDRKKVIERA